MKLTKQIFLDGAKGYTNVEYVLYGVRLLHEVNY